MRDVSLGFVHFRTLDLQHLDAAWYSVSRQDFHRVNAVFFLDNNTEDDADAILEVLDRYPVPVPRFVCFSKHGRTDRTQSWSVNRVAQAVHGPWLFFTRSDYILAFDAIPRMLEAAEGHVSVGRKPFVSGWCFQMAYDREAANLNVFVDIEQYDWRAQGFSALLQHPYAFRFHETDQDAGVWLTRPSYMAEAGWMNEQMVSWGFQQSLFQRELRAKAGVHCEAIQDYLFAHQHHAAPRDFRVAQKEYVKFGGSR